MKKKLTALVAATAAVVPLTNPGPAAAAAAGALAFECTAKLNFPTTAGTGKCEGSIAPAAAAGPVAGLSTVGPFVLTGTGSFSAEFTHAEGCVAGEPSAVGTAQGTALIEGLGAVHNGAVTTADARISFDWIRTGLTAAVVIRGGSITFHDGSGGTAALGTSPAAATFLPILGQGNTCPQGGYMEAVVVGAATVAGV